MFMKRVYDPKYFEGNKYIPPLFKDKILFYIPPKPTTCENKPKKKETKLT